MMETTLVTLRSRRAPVRSQQDNFSIVWLGLDFFAWTRMLRKNFLRLSLGKLPLACAITLCSLLQTLAGRLEHLIYGGRISRIEISEPPIFVIGHWRSGTSLLHELLGLDRRHTYPTNFECFNAAHFLISERFFKPLLNLVMPEGRPQDNMSVSLDTPQEDECALCCLGAPSPYADIAFPNLWHVSMDTYDLEGLPCSERQRWEKAFVGFLKKVTFAKPGRIILKSPTHTFRIKVLLKLFPDARFVHIARSPYSVYSSTMHAWKAVCLAFALQVPDFTGLEEYVFEMFVRAHEKVDEARDLIPKSHFYELRYEDLVKNSEGELRRLYDNLGLNDFDTELLPALKKYLAERTLYRTNRYSHDPETTARINHRWGSIIRKYGYEMLGH
jgi:hypothetical protein